MIIQRLLDQRRPTLSLVLLVGAAAVLAPRVAGASMTRAEAHKNEAFRKFAAGEYPAGIAEMEKAFALVPHPGFLLNIAVAYDQWGGRCEESLSAFDRFFEHCGADCELHRSGAARVDQVRERCMAEISLSSEPSGAEVLFDGEHVGRTPFTLRVRPGTHEIEAYFDGYRTSHKRVTVRGQEQRRISLELKRRPRATPSPGPGVTTTPPAPDLVVQAPPTVDDGNYETLRWSSFALGAGGLVTGAAFTAATLSSLSQEEEARRMRRPIREIEAIQAQAQGRAIVANVGFVVGLVGAAAGVVFLALDGGGGSSDLAAGPSGGRWSVTF